MTILSMRARKRFFEIGLTALVAWSSLVLQFTILNKLPVHEVVCNLPLTIVIVWGAVFGSRLPAISADELRLSSVWQIFFRQAASGSVSGALLGALFGALYSSVLPVYPLYFPLAGWIAGYFCLRNLNKENLLCIPLVLVLTGLAESLMAWQLWFLGRACVFETLSSMVLPEALLNAIIAPFIYFPMRRWYDLSAASGYPVESQ